MKFRSLIALALIALPAAVHAQKTVIGNSTATLSPGIRVGDMVYTSGQLPARGDSTIEGQTKSTLEKIEGILKQAGTTKDHVVKCTVFLVDARDFGGMNRAYQEFFTKEPPARSTIVVAALVAPGKLEIECIAAMPK
jgi:2-iminobutanoate/2-iminopropanoate deaminase